MDHGACDFVQTARKKLATLKREGQDGESVVFSRKLLSKEVDWRLWLRSGDFRVRFADVGRPLVISWRSIERSLRVLPVERGLSTVGGKDVPLVNDCLKRQRFTSSRCPGDLVTMTRDELLLCGRLAMLTELFYSGLGQQKFVSEFLIKQRHEEK